MNIFIEETNLHSIRKTAVFCLTTYLHIYEENIQAHTPPILSVLRIYSKPSGLEPTPSLHRLIEKIFRLERCQNCLSILSLNLQSMFIKSEPMRFYVQNKPHTHFRKLEQHLL